jgi:hypothetical protein
MRMKSQMHIKCATFGYRDPVPFKKPLQQFLGGCIPKRLHSSQPDNKKWAISLNPKQDTLIQELPWWHEYAVMAWVKNR